MKLNNFNYVAVSRALDVDEYSFSAFRQGVIDGYNQGFELSSGMSYDELNDQWAYDLGTYIGACWAVRQ